MKRGILFVISAPSGTGKTTLLRRVMGRLEGLNFSVSHTTRAPRPGEQDGRDYHFIPREEFEVMIEGNRFVEWARVHDNLYGTATAGVVGQLAQGEDVILDIDVQGAAIIRESSELEGVHIFIAPPRLAILKERLKGRNTDSDETIELRLKNAVTEMASAPTYDYLIVNDDLDEAAEMLASIIIAERARCHRRPNGEPLQFEKA
ncbi:guanylate kinase [Desulfopila sp. IMCC35008]|uniref:guanylate kinase n=1 Tax=Desulfopila sp. IMCC35008 TaxID=2653858 RepID=UPI0013D6C103|nr:guanylate kinase [Desulfopila sp. IMCC35008]